MSTIITDSHVFFFGKDMPPSQWYPCKFTGLINGYCIEFNCAEQWMMANKAAMLKDKAAYLRIMRASDPCQQKFAGKDVTPYDDAQWSAKRFEIVVDGNIAKFSQNPELREWLLKAGEGRKFVEASPYDPIWGIGLSAPACQRIPEKDWPGANLLGKSLDQVCQQLRIEAEEKAYYADVRALR